MNRWIYNGSLDAVSKTAFGFVYLIANLKTNKMYVGKKSFKKWNGEESDWQIYHGSCKSLNEDIKLHGKDFLKREILHICLTEEEMDKKEIEEQLKRDVVNNPMYYNGRVGDRFLGMKRINGRLQKKIVYETSDR